MGRVVELRKSYNITPTQEVAIVTVQDGERTIELPRWSFVPYWWNQAKAPKFAMFNARDNKQKASGFRPGAINSYGCIIPASGF